MKSVLLPSGSLRHAGRTTDMTCPCLPLTLLCSCSILYHLVSHLSAALLQAHLRRAGTISTPASGCCTLCSFCILSAARLVAATSALSVEEELLVGLPETSRQTVQVGTVMVPSCRFTNPKNLEHPLTNMMATEPTSGQQSLSQFQPSGHHCCRR